MKKIMPMAEPSRLVSPRQLWRNLTSAGFNQVNSSEEDHIIIEDFQVLSHLGLDLCDETGRKIAEESPNKEFGGFCHTIRTERLVFGSKITFLIKFLLNTSESAPSVVEGMRERKLIDFDGFMRGNPPCLIMRFDLL